MAMHFIFSDTAVLLFDFWSVHSPAGMALSVLVLLLLAVLYEGIKVGKAKLLNQVLVNLPTSISQQTIAETDGDSAGSDSFPVGRTHHRPDDPTTAQPPSYLSAFAQDVLPPLLPYQSCLSFLALLKCHRLWETFPALLGTSSSGPHST
ncbi:protein SLC31A2 isoform X1 [Pan paniscus]|uniref:protein SLC31A2 isoform X1 n=1 Tax=Pan paniscus TaxID=9597 RepID=UPI0006C970C9|nr:protein SLC31A2 isoform X1 [Pan paniscus]